MRTAPVLVLTQAAIEVDVGAAMAGKPIISEAAIAAKTLRDDMETSVLYLAEGD
jgi:hypothetical protein